jgi:hypothetical protein
MTPRPWQGADDQADGGALHAQHRGQVLMGEGQGIPAGAVVQGQNPAAAARLHTVYGVARHRLQGLRQQRLDELQDELPDCGPGLEHAPQGFGVEPRRRTPDLDHIAPQRPAGGQRRGQAEQGLAPEHRHLDNLAVGQDGNE